MLHGFFPQGDFHRGSISEHLYWQKYQFIILQIGVLFEGIPVIQYATALLYRLVYNILFVRGQGLSKCRDKGYIWDDQSPTIKPMLD